MTLDLPTSSRELGDSGSDSNEADSNTPGQTTSTNTPTKSTPRTSEKKTTIQATLGESIQKISLTSISFVQDFLANRFPQLVNGKVSRTLGARFSSRYVELRNLKDLHYYSSKTLKDSLTMTEEELSQSSFKRWMNWGIGSNGNFLTARTLEYHKVDNASLLLDIIEDEAEAKYFPSSNYVKSMETWLKGQMEAGNGFYPRLLLKLTDTISFISGQEKVFDTLHRLNASGYKGFQMDGQKGYRMSDDGNVWGTRSQ